MIMAYYKMVTIASITTVESWANTGRIFSDFFFMNEMYQVSTNIYLVLFGEVLLDTTSISPQPYLLPL